MYSQEFKASFVLPSQSIIENTWKVRNIQYKCLIALEAILEGNIGERFEQLRKRI